MRFNIVLDKNRILQSYNIFRNSMRLNINKSYSSTLKHGEKFLNETFQKSYERISFDSSIKSTMNAIVETSDISTVGC